MSYCLLIGLLWTNWGLNEPCFFVFFLPGLCPPIISSPARGSLSHPVIIYFMQRTFMHWGRVYYSSAALIMIKIIRELRNKDVLDGSFVLLLFLELRFNQVNLRNNLASTTL